MRKPTSLPCPHRTLRRPLASGGRPVVIVSPPSLGDLSKRLPFRKPQSECPTLGCCRGPWWVSQGTLKKSDTGLEGGLC